MMTNFEERLAAINETLNRMSLIDKINRIDNLLDKQMELIERELNMIEEPEIEVECSKTINGAIELIELHDIVYNNICEAYSFDETTDDPLQVSLKEYRNLTVNLIARYKNILANVG